jgi:Fe2+ transport system protein FeoA
VLRFFSRRSAARSLTVLAADSATGAAVAAPADAAADAACVGPSCALAACAPGARATVLALCCGDQEACRLRALGLSEGVSVDVVDARHAMLVDVRGTRIALGRALTAGITVQPIAS